MTDLSPLIKKQKTEHENPTVSLQEKDGDRYRCMFILVKKGGRQCNMTRKKGDKFCAQHKLVSSKIHTLSCSTDF